MNNWWCGVTIIARADASKWFIEFKGMFEEKHDVDDIGEFVLKIFKLLQLGKNEKAALSMDSK